MLGLSPLEAGRWSLPPLAAGIAATTLAPRVVRRICPGFVIGAGLAVAAAGFAMISQVAGGSGLAVAVIGLTIAFTDLLPVGMLCVDIVVVWLGDGCSAKIHEFIRWQRMCSGRRQLPDNPRTADRQTIAERSEPGGGNWAGAVRCEDETRW